MSEEPRIADDYEPRQVTAAKRVIIDVMQVLASFENCLVLRGGVSQSAFAKAEG